MKYTSLVALVGALFVWRPAGGYAVLLQFVICGSASLVAWEAARSRKYLWTIVFGAIALLFNPLVTVPFTRGLFPWISIFCFTMFLASLRFLKTAPRVSMASVTYEGPRSQSL
jgi:Family of unknown function (DUF6804)